ncbi:hypothetical protein [Nostoc sp. ChiQUE01b]|uniref:hypothetical protein n=1 Tax=Nostoc sp. ChiQUE01b TaxID=3075376 RepID=UPI002AD368BA|nr:hypothetical protein [Nostoc sp. ChiQUE01b]MDZ8257345.1 hypothetical protein [Nostoc sp. ChiQUE01b]
MNLSDRYPTKLEGVPLAKFLSMSSIWREAEEEINRAIAINLLRRKVAIDIITPSTGLSIEEVQQPQQQLNESR